MGEQHQDFSILASGGKLGGGERGDTLENSSSARVLDLICEGPIKRLVDADKGIFLNKTAARGTDNNLNFEGFSYAFRTGTQTQAPIVGFDSIESETSVGVEVRNDAAPIVRTITNANMEAVRVRLRWERIFKLDSRGRTQKSSVDLRIEIRQGAGAWVTRVSERVSGISRGAYEKAWVIAVSGTGPWDVRITRMTADPTGDKEFNAFTWASYTEIIYEKLRYPNSVICGQTFQADQFSAIPTRQYLVEGMLVRIPSNATVDPVTGRLTYTGIWSGTFQTQWTSNPAWCLYDLLTNDRYGCKINSANLDKWAFYTIGQYCDQLVPDGKGGQEPRFSCNLEINSRAEAYEWINKIVSIFRGIAMYEEGSITLSQDSPGAPVAVFNQANVKGGDFSYAGSSRSARHSVAIVSWQDPADFYQKVPKVIVNEAAIKLYGYKELRLDAVGCTSEGQAHRVAQWALLSEFYETDTVTFVTGSQGIPCRTGQLITVSDPYRSEDRQSGQVQAATLNTITLDAPVSLPAVPYSIEIMRGDGEREVRSITLLSDRVVSVVPNFTEIPFAGAAWSLYPTASNGSQYRVLGVDELDNGEYEITAISHDPAKYAQIETGYSFEDKTLPRRSTDPVPSPRNVVAEVYIVDGQTPYLGVGWEVPLYQGAPDPTVAGYEIQIRNVETANWSSTRSTANLSLEYPSVEGDTVFQAQVRAVSQAGKRSPWALSPARTVGLPPVIASYSPLTGTEGTEITILGEHFIPGDTRVYWATILGDNIVVNPAGTIITVNVPVGATSGTITVETSFGRSSL